MKKIILILSLFFLVACNNQPKNPHLGHFKCEFIYGTMSLELTETEFIGTDENKSISAKYESTGNNEFRVILDNVEGLEYGPFRYNPDDDSITLIDLENEAYNFNCPRK